MTPQNALASSGYCLANPGREYLVYAPNGGAVTVDLEGAEGTFAVEWLNPSMGEQIAGTPVEGGSRVSLQPPFYGDAVVYLSGTTLG
jgi:hypothetical protein